MRILAVSDEVERVLYNPRAGKFVGDVDLLLSCGDVPFYYLDYLASTLNVPCCFVFGNHGFELEHRADEVGIAYPRAGTDLHRHPVNENGLLLAGLEGCMRYNNAPRFQYTDAQMQRHVVSLVPRLVINRLVHGRYLDVLITHAPPYGIHDQKDRCHTGFKSFLWFMRTFRPRFLLHGHIHIFTPKQVVATRYAATDVINIYPYRVLELDPGTIS